MPYYSNNQKDSVFIDRKVTHVKAGNGGGGHVSFLRLPYYPKGGPDGGDGGTGGSVYIEAKENLSGKDLRRIKTEYAAMHGEKGKKRQMGGKNGKDVVIHVPRGTIVRKYIVDTSYKSLAEDDQHEEPLTVRSFRDRKPDIFIADLQDDGQRVLLARGGRGGLGNQHFATAKDQTPMRAQPGRDGEESWINIELKSIADIGLVGYPNAGKSTVLSKISRKKPAISTFPFTTLSPNLGVVTFDDDPAEEDRFTVADLPGLIEGAHADVGLGHNFLRHIERTQMLVYVLDMGHYENIGLKKENFHEEGIPQLEEASQEGDLSGAIIPDQFDMSEYMPTERGRDDEPATRDLDTLMDDYNVDGLNSSTRADDIPEKRKNYNQKRRRRMNKKERAEYDRLNPRQFSRRVLFIPTDEDESVLTPATRRSKVSFPPQEDEVVPSPDVLTAQKQAGVTEKFAWSKQPDVYQQDVRRRINQVKHQIYMYKPWEVLEKLKTELDQYQPGLSSRAKIIIANKMDVPGSDEHLTILRTKTDLPIIPISAQEGYNMEGVVNVIRNVLREQRRRLKQREEV